MAAGKPAGGNYPGPYGDCIQTHQGFTVQEQARAAKTAVGSHEFSPKPLTQGGEGGGPSGRTRRVEATMRRIAVEDLVVAGAIGDNCAECATANQLEGSVFGDVRFARRPGEN